MTLEIKGKCFLCCAKNKKIFYKKKIKQKMKYSVLFTDLISEADHVLLIGTPDETMTKEIVQAKSLKVGVRTLSETEIQELEREERNEEQRFSSRNHSREYER